MIGGAAVHESKISKRGQTTLPKAVREALGLQPGDRVRYFIHDGDVKILPVRPVTQLYGILKYDGPAVSVEEMNDAIAAAACAK